MENLVGDPAVQKKIDECQVQAIVPHNLNVTLYAKKEISRFVDPISDDEIALITKYTKHDQSTYSVVSRLRIGNIVYELKIP